MPVPGLHRAINRLGTMMRGSAAKEQVMRARARAPQSLAAPVVFGHGMNALIGRVGRQGAERQGAGSFSHAFREHFMTPFDRRATGRVEHLDTAAREDPIQRARKDALALGMGEVQEVLDRNMANRRAQIVNPKTPAEAQKMLAGMREIGEIQAMFLEALREGQIRNFGDERKFVPEFYAFLRRRFERMKQNPEFAAMNPKSAEYYARLSLARFMRFSTKELADLKMAMASFGEARRDNYLSLNE